MLIVTRVVIDVVVVVVVRLGQRVGNQCDPPTPERLSHSLTLFLYRFITMYPSDTASGSFDLRTLRAVKVLRPLRLVSGIPSTYEAAIRIHYFTFICAARSFYDFYSLWIAVGNLPT